MLNVDIIKIDSSLVRLLCSDKNAHLITRSIVSFAKEMNIETIAEFVSNKKLFSVVQDLNIDFAQGYYIGKPSPELLLKPDFLIQNPI